MKTNTPTKGELQEIRPTNPSIYPVTIRPIRILSIGFAIISLWACGQSQLADNTERAELVRHQYRDYLKLLGDIPSVTPREAHQLSMRDSVVLIDARTRKEQQISMIPGAVSAQDFDENPGEDIRSKKLLVYCTIGYRSGIRVKHYCSSGLDAYNIEGGILGWLHDGLPVEDTDNILTRKIHVYGEDWDLAPLDYKSVY